MQREVLSVSFCTVFAMSVYSATDGRKTPSTYEPVTRTSTALIAGVRGLRTPPHEYLNTIQRVRASALSL